jgi:integrase
MFDDACRSKVLALRVLPQNRATDVQGPDEGVKKSKSYIFPSSRCEAERPGAASSACRPRATSPSSCGNTSGGPAWSAPSSSPTTDTTRKQLTFHDLRATGITWMALRSDEPIKIMRRAGHEDIATTMGYVREAENLMHSVGEPFPPLPAALLVSSAESSEGPAHWAQLRESTYKTVASPAGFEPA